MAEAALTSALSKLGELAVSEAKLLIQVGDDIVLLRDRLEWLQALVRDTDRKRRAGTDGLTTVWVRQTREVAFQAEDAIDDFFFHHEVINQHGRACRRALKRLRGFFTCIVVRHGLSGRITRIKSRLDQISANQKEYNIEHAPTMALASSNRAIAAWRDDLDDAVGFNEDVVMVKRMLVREENDGKPTPMFISIVGESGAGKKKLAKIIHGMMKSEKNLILVWYEMEPGSEMADLLKQVFHLAFAQCPADDVLEQQEERLPSTDYGDKLRVLLASKRYLLILSGISSKTTLNSLRASLPDPDQGNNDGGHVILLLDTENEELAWHANTMNIDGMNGIHLLPCLGQAGTRELFYWKVFRKEERERMQRKNEYYHDGFEAESQVHNITGGHPMAIVLLAGLLRFKERPNQWNAVLAPLALPLYRPPGPDDAQTNQLLGTRRGIEIIFWACFEDLPNNLRSCFLYFASYPSNTRKYADEVVRMWVAEGFIDKRRHGGKTMEEIGQDYLKELVLRCFVEVEEMKPGGGILVVRVHKSIIGFLRSEVRESGFMEIHHVDDDITVPPLARRLSVHSDKNRNNNGTQYSTTFTTHQKLPKLRSFVCHCHVDRLHDFKFLSSAKFIRVISVRWLNMTTLPDQISDMIQLRYLRLECPDLCSLPPSIARLLNLQTLDIRKTNVEAIDLDFWKIKTLRHVLARNLKLPTAMGAAVVEEGQGGGSELQTLHGVRPVDLEEWSAPNCPLRNMTSLLSLEMGGFKDEMHGGNAFEAALGNMFLLGHLNLEGDKIPSCVFTVQSLRSLQTMELRGIVDWKSIAQVVGRRFRTFRPNLAQLKLQDISQVPPNIKEQLGKKLVQG